MKFEHMALNVPQPREMGRWYVEHMSFRIVRASEQPPYGRFLADMTGRVILELYCDATPAPPDYGAIDPQTFHIAFASDDAAGAMRRLEAAGAKIVSHRPLPTGTTLVMMRDPWGVPIQICQRPQPL